MKYGFSLLEVTISLAISVITMVALVQLFLLCTKTVQHRKNSAAIKQEIVSVFGVLGRVVADAPANKNEWLIRAPQSCLWRDEQGEQSGFFYERETLYKKRGKRSIILLKPVQEFSCVYHREHDGMKGMSVTIGYQNLAMTSIMPLYKGCS